MELLTVDYERFKNQLRSPHPAYLTLVFSFIFTTFLYKYLYFFLYAIFAKFWNLPTPAHNGNLAINYKVFLFFTIALLALFYIWYFTKKYSKALGNEVKLNKAILSKALNCSLPLVVYYIWKFLNFAPYIVEQKPARKFAISNYAWEPFGWGTEPLGVILASFTILFFPVVEEIFLSLLFIKLAKKTKVTVALVLAALIFAALHIPTYGLGNNVFFLFLAGLSSITARLWTGTWKGGLVVHILVNVSIFLPKWFVFTSLFFL